MEDEKGLPTLPRLSPDLEWRACSAQGSQGARTPKRTERVRVRSHAIDVLAREHLVQRVPGRGHRGTFVINSASTETRRSG